MQQSDSEPSLPAPFAERPISYIAVSRLTIHPEIVGDPRLAPKDPRFIAMQTAWREVGIVPPLYVTQEAEIVDGRHRYWFAKSAGIEELPCVTVTEDEVPTVVVQGLIGRNHVSKGQLAYLAAPRLAGAIEAARERRIKILQSGGRLKRSDEGSMETIVEKLGISRKLLSQAHEIHEHFDADKKLKEEWEPKILDGESPLGLGSVLQGIGGSLATKGKPRSPTRNSALHNLVAGFKNQSRCVKHWRKWSEVDRSLVEESFHSFVQKMPGDFLNMCSAVIRRELKAQKANASS